MNRIFENSIRRVLVCFKGFECFNLQIRIKHIKIRLIKLHLNKFGFSTRRRMIF